MIASDPTHLVPLAVGLTALAGALWLANVWADIDALVAAEADPRCRQCGNRLVVTDGDPTLDPPLLAISRCPSSSCGAAPIYHFWIDHPCC